MTVLTPEPGWQIEPGSFRDPAARVVYRHDDVYRLLTPGALQDWELLQRTRLFERFSAEGRVVATERVDDVPLPQPGPFVAALRHARIPVVSYPYEWPFGMLRDAALLQLDLMLAALDEGLMLKDATPFNIQWAGTRPVFVDIASFTRLAANEPWAGYRQFCQSFLYPLLLQAYKGVPFQGWLRGNPEGIEAADLARLLSLRDRLRGGVLTHVDLQARLQARYGGTRHAVRDELRAAGFGTELIKHNVSRLRRLVERLEWAPARSTWSDYATSNSYDAENRERKMAFVRRAVSGRSRRLVWDLGTNTGEYARGVRDLTDYIVAVDADHLAIERQYAELRQASETRILPLVGDVMNPSPGLGWRNRERSTLVDRARPDLVLALALIHHLAVGRNLPLADFLDWLASVTPEVVLEFVAPEDAMVKQLLRNRPPIDLGYTVEHFEQAAASHFTIAAQDALPSGTRTLYHLVRRV